MSLNTTAATWVTGTIVTAAQLNLEVRDAINGLQAAWASYTPTWTGSGTNPTAASHTLAGFYRQIGKSIDFRITLTFGAANYGTGSYIFGLPVASAAGYVTAARSSVGNTMLFDTSAALHLLRHTIPASTTTLVVSDDAYTFFAQTVPFTVATGDQAVILGRYEAA